MAVHSSPASFEPLQPLECGGEGAGPQDTGGDGCAPTAKINVAAMLAASSHRMVPVRPLR